MCFVLGNRRGASYVLSRISLPGGTLQRSPAPRNTPPRRHCYIRLKGISVLVVLISLAGRTQSIRCRSWRSTPHHLVHSNLVDRRRGLCGSGEQRCCAESQTLAHRAIQRTLGQYLSIVRRPCGRAEGRLESAAPGTVCGYNGGLATPPEVANFTRQPTCGPLSVATTTSAWEFGLGLVLATHMSWRCPAGEA